MLVLYLLFVQLFRLIKVIGELIRCTGGHCRMLRVWQSDAPFRYHLCHNWKLRFRSNVGPFGVVSRESERKPVTQLGVVNG